MTGTALHAGCAIVEPTATTRVQWIKTWQLLKVLLRLTRDLFALFVQQ